MALKKTTKSSKNSRKKSTASKKTAAKKSTFSRRKNTKTISEKSNKPRYILTIMILLTIIIYLVIREQNSKVKPDEKIVKKNEEVKKDKVNNKKEDNVQENNKVVKSYVSLYYIKIMDNGSLKYVPIEIAIDEKQKFRNGYKQINELISSIPELNLRIILAKKNFPIEILNKLDSLLESTQLGKGKILRFSRFTTI